MAKKKKLRPDQVCSECGEVLSLLEMKHGLCTKCDECPPESICCDDCGYEYDRHIGDDCPNCGGNNHDQYEEKYG